MRRTTASLAVCLCAVAGCRGGAAQEPYDRVIAVAQRPATAAAIPAPQAPEAEPIASEVDIPWAIALLSDARAPAVKKVDRVIVVDAEPDVPETIVQEADLRVAVDPASGEEKAATPKTCNGVVNRRS